MRDLRMLWEGQNRAKTDIKSELGAESRSYAGNFAGKCLPIVSKFYA